MVAELLGYNIVSKKTYKKVTYIGINNLRKKEDMKEHLRVYPPSKFIWVEYRIISAPKTSRYSYKKWGEKNVW